MSNFKRVKTINVITPKDRERFEEECDLSKGNDEPRASEDFRPSEVSLKTAKNYNSVLGWQVEELQEELEKKMERIGVLEVAVSQLNNTVDDNKCELRRAKDKNDVLQSSLEEAIQEAKVLRVDLETKTRDLKLMEEHAKNSNIEVAMLERSRTDTVTELQKNKEENTRLKLEVDNSRRISSMEREESEHLANDLAKAEKENKLMTKKLEDAQKSLKALEGENIRLAEEIKIAKSTLQTKIIELNDTKQEVEFLRRPKCNTSRKSSIYEIRGSERMSKVDSGLEPDAYQSRRSDFQPNMFQLLKSLRGRSSIFSSNYFSSNDPLLEVKEEEVNEADLQDNFLSRETYRVSAGGTHRESTKWNGETMVSVDEHVERSMSDEKEPCQMDILDIYAHLTAAAVKANYPDVDVSNAYLIRLGTTMPFWELHPYFTHIFESVREKNNSKEKNKSRRNSTNSTTGGWFRWMRKRGQSDAS